MQQNTTCEWGVSRLADRTAGTAAASAFCLLADKHIQQWAVMRSQLQQWLLGQGAVIEKRVSELLVCRLTATKLFQPQYRVCNLPNHAISSV